MVIDNQHGRAHIPIVAEIPVGCIVASTNLHDPICVQARTQDCGPPRFASAYPLLASNAKGIHRQQEGPMRKLAIVAAMRATLGFIWISAPAQAKTLGPTARSRSAATPRPSATTLLEWSNTMKRIAVTVALGALLGLLGGMITASPALARGPKWDYADAQPFTLDASFCGFEVGVSFSVDKSYFKVLKTADGSMTFVSNGLVTVTYTNLQTGKAITENEPGPSKPTVFPDGSLTVTAGGHSGIFLTPAEAEQFGLPTVSVTVGGLQESVAPDGSITSLILNGHVAVDVCAALS
jgi:hypothetical protein